MSFLKKFILSVFICLALCSCDQVYQEKRWIGKTEQEMIQKLGPPEFSVVLDISSSARLYEHQSGLYAFLPADKNQKVEIKELQWKKTGRTIAIWFQRKGSDWVVIDTLIWSDGVVF